LPFGLLLDWAQAAATFDWIFVNRIRFGNCHCWGFPKLASNAENCWQQREGTEEGKFQGCTEISYIETIEYY
jgi:hypothetical protein